MPDSSKPVGDSTLDEFFSLGSSPVDEFFNQDQEPLRQPMSTLLANSVARSGYDAWNNLLELKAKAQEKLGDIEGAKELRAGIDQSKKEAVERFPLDAAQSIEETDWSDPGEVTRLLSSSAARQTSYIGSTVAASLAAATVGPYVGIGGTAAAALGGFLSSTALNTGEVVSEAREAGKDTSLLTDLAIGGAMGGLDSLLPVAIARRFGLGAKQSSDLVESIAASVSSKLLGKSVVGGVVRGGTGEAIIETTQEAIAAGYRAWYDENYDFLSEETKSRLQNAFVLSLLPGGAAGGVTNALSSATPENTNGTITNNAKAGWVVGDEYSGFSYPAEPEGVFADINNLNYEQRTALLKIPSTSTDPNWVDKSDEFIGWAKEVATKIFGAEFDQASTSGKSFEITVEDPITGNSLGYFDSNKLRTGFDGLINISPDKYYDPRATFHHEIFHALRALGLVTKTEWDMLKQETDANNYFQKFDVFGRWRYASPEYWTKNFGYAQDKAETKALDSAYEEVGAELLANYWVESRKADFANLKDPPPPLMRRVFDKIVRFLTGDRFKLIKTQITEIKDMESFFKAALRGELKDRVVAPADRSVKAQEPGAGVVESSPSASAAAPAGPSPVFDFRNYNPNTNQSHVLGAQFVQNLSKRGMLGALGDKGRQFAWWYHKFVWDLRQLAHMFPNFQPLQNYREYMQLYDTKVKEWLKQADKTRQGWVELGHKRNIKVGEVLFDLRTGVHLKGVYYNVFDDTGKLIKEVKTKKEADAFVAANPTHTYTKIEDNKPRWPTPAEYQKILKSHGLEADVEAQQTIENIKDDFKKVLTDIQKTTIVNLEKMGLVFDWNTLNSFGIANPTQINAAVLQQIQSLGIPVDPLMLKVVEINELTDALRNQPYFPLSRFGKYAVIVKKGTVTKYAEQFESETAATNRLNELKRDPGLVGHVVTKLKVDEELRGFQGIPPTLIDSIKDSLHLNQSQQAELRDLAYSYLPQTSFLQHLRKASLKPGFSRDAVRAYATYFNTVSRFLGRLEYAPDMNRAIKEAAPDTQLGGDQVWKSRIRDYMQWHYQNTILNPNGDWQFATSVSFLWHFFLNASTAILNATQPAMTAMPYLSSTFGQAKAIKEMTTSYGQIRGMFYGNYPNLTNEEREVFKIAEATVNDEGLALDLAASAESMSAFNLRRLSEHTKLGKFQNYLSGMGTFMFSGIEKLNRRVVYMAALRLAQKNQTNQSVASLPTRFRQTYAKLTAPAADGGYGLSPATAKAHIFAVEAVRDTMYEYSAWARPRVLQGFNRALFPFYNFIFKSLFFIRHMPGGMKYAAAMAFLAGMSGLPGAEDLMAFARLISPKDFNPELFIREMLHEFDEDSKVFWPDVVMHGVTSQLPISIGPRLGMGNIVPGAEALSNLLSGSGNFQEGLGRLGQDAGGAFFNIPLNITRAAVAGEDVSLARKLEMASPTMIKKMFQVQRYLADQASVGLGGETQVRFDLENPRDMAAIIGTAIGFTPQKVTEFHGMRRMQMHASTYWNSRRTGLLSQYEAAYRSKDPEQRKYVMSRINEYNNEVPFHPLKLSAGTILDSLKSRIKMDTRKELGLGPSKAQQGIYQRVERTYNR